MLFRSVVLYLEEQFRQDDGDLLDILNSLRSNNIRRHHAETLLSRIDIEPPDGDITELHTMNIDVDKINEKRLAELDSEESNFTFFAGSFKRKFEKFSSFTAVKFSSKIGFAST